MTNAALTDAPTRNTLGVTLSTTEAEILRQLRSLRFGQVTVQVHDARVVQIERTEKLRPEAADTTRAR